MCGIAGLFSPRQPPRREELAAMARALHHRGPDGQGVWHDGPIGLAHARLAIIDLDGGAQPMASADGRVQLVFNGEIFNYIELRAELRALGRHFRTDSDTEVLLQAYQAWGDGFLSRLNGQFAIGLWDAERQRLLLARDGVGIRPLFWTRMGERLAFASEAKALFALPAVPRALDPAGLAASLGWWAPLAPRTAFDGIHCLPPGHRLVVDAAGEHLSRWWDWDFPDSDPFAPVDEDALADQLHALLVDAVRLQLRADVPVGAYLSGGLDSSILTTIIRRHTDTPLRCFSLTFDEAEYDESAHQRLMVRHLDTRHSAIGCGRADIAAAFARSVWHAETPLVRTAPAPMLRLADSVRAAGYKVVLTGEGADEVFGGYDLFKEAKIRRFVARLPGSARRARAVERLYPWMARSPGGAHNVLAQRFFTDSRVPDGDPGFAHQTRLASTRRAWAFFTPEWQHRLAAHEPAAQWRARVPEAFAHWQPLARDQYTEAHTLMSGYLLAAQGDRMAMAASIEGRYPFLDPRVIAFAAALPPRLKMRGLREKLLLRQAFARELPPAIGQRTKQPYRSPDSASFFEDGQPLPWVRELLSEGSLREAGLFDAPAVARLSAKCAAGRAIGFADNMAFVGVLSTQLLHRQFVRAEAPAMEPS
ncbi:asparagine synthase (glutamine-hydrolyzing) [Hydrogenophaga borbori]|uniref:asparagine synthase (glutamine-hydrolyzing) n=1 Tax=Hydrogenophaga borbori TaxID=2294117 RepID=A0A372EL84_9BURK|nr:asparagine synthase (glutamine-hydrolyzing) [Hydrogenophaga borbori]RFP80173.1 asparagine synthase (glutamine-hydrolyzing) [Hydrogenophaga borbori]